MFFGERPIVAKLQRIPVNQFLAIGALLNLCSLGTTQCSQSAAYTGKCAHGDLISLGATQCVAEICEFWECLNNRAQVQRIPVDRLLAIALLLLLIWGERLRVAKVQCIPVNALMAVGLLLKSVFAANHLT